MSPRVSLAFAKLPDTQLDNFAQAVIEQMTGNAAFPSPPVAMADLQAASDDYVTKSAAAVKGGQADTAAKNNARVVLVEMLRRLAGYVQIHCNNDLAVLLSSGFQTQNPNRASSPLAQPQGLIIRHGVSGQLLAGIKPVRNARMYEGRIKGPGGDWAPSVFASDSRRIVFEGLTPGTIYTVQVRALGGSTGQSDWSDPSSHMAM
ncbi:MAG TPA: fibronectin type III domain-containing protein [Pyrinomonadaceae bacterium]|nr:fibronectin type III domain-containing protein [Pyrinomonadaceae bacterium]